MLSLIAHLWVSFLNQNKIDISFLTDIMLVIDHKIIY